MAPRFHSPALRYRPISPASLVTRTRGAAGAEFLSGEPRRYVAHEFRAQSKPVSVYASNRSEARQIAVNLLGAEPRKVLVAEVGDLASKGVC